MVQEHSSELRGLSKTVCNLKSLFYDLTRVICDSIQSKCTESALCVVLIQTLTVTQLVKKQPAFYGTRKPATGPYPEPDESNSQFPIILL
jgi:hypothetical protein